MRGPREVSLRSALRVQVERVLRQRMDVRPTRRRALDDLHLEPPRVTARSEISLRDVELVRNGSSTLRRLWMRRTLLPVGTPVQTTPFWPARAGDKTMVQSTGQVHWRPVPRGQRLLFPTQLVRIRAGHVEILRKCQGTLSV